MQPEPDTHVIPPRNGAEHGPRPAKRDDSEPLILQRWVGRYELIHRIAHGGMATVYLGRAKGKAGFEKVVAVKVIHPHLANEAEFVGMFLDEARIAARIHHPHVVEILDLGERDGVYYMVMEFIEGENLAALIRATQAEPLPIPVILQLLADTLEGLGAAHELRDADGRPYRLVHRDVSPHNILLNLDGWAKVGDFGIMKAAGKASNTKTGELRGKLAYMSPEQARGGIVDHRTDLFAVGVIGWELLTGKRLFACESEAATLEKVLACEVPAIDCSSDPARGERPELAEADELREGLDALLRKALAVEAADRFADAAQMLADVKRLARLSEAIPGGDIDPRAFLAKRMNRFFRKRVDYARAALRRTGEHDALAAAAAIAVDPGAQRWTNEPTVQVGRPPTGSNPAASGPFDARTPTGSNPAQTPSQSYPAAGFVPQTGTHPGLDASGAMGTPMRQWPLLVLLPMVGAGIAVAAMLLLDPFQRSSDATTAPGEPVGQREQRDTPRSLDAQTQYAPATTTRTTEPSVDPSAGPEVDPVVGQVRWHFTTTPEGATVYIDGEAWSEPTPTTIVVPKTDDKVQVRLELDGHVTQTLRLEPLGDQNFDRQLATLTKDEPARTKPKNKGKVQVKAPETAAGAGAKKQFLPPPDSLRSSDGQ